MRFYDEARAERKIRRKAFFLTLLIMSSMIGTASVVFSESPGDFLPDTVKELFWEPEQKNDAKPSKKKA